MLNVNEVWARVSQLPAYRDRKLADFVIQAWDINQQLTTSAGAGGTADNQPVTFAAGAIIVGIGGAARPNGQAATLADYAPGNDLYKISIADQQSNRSIIGRTRAIASSVFGNLNDLFPAKEIIIPTNGTLIYSFENLTTSTIDITITHHLLVPAAIS